MNHTITKNDVYIVVPVFNEDQEIVHDVVRGVMRAGYENIIIVDDGSEAPFQSLLPTSVLVLRHTLNRGKGAAVQTGTSLAFMREFLAVITFDGDGQHDAMDLDLLRTQLNNGHDIVLGTRKDLLQNMPLYKIAANKIGNIVTWAFFGLWVTDSQSGLRGYTRSAISLMDLKSDRYEYESEVIREIARKNISFTEVPITVFYTVYSQSKQTRQSFVNGIKTIIRLFWL